MLEITKMFSKYIPAQQARGYKRLRIAALDFFESKGIKNPPELDLSMLLVDYMLEFPNEDSEGWIRYED